MENEPKKNKVNKLLIIILCLLLIVVCVLAAYLIITMNSSTDKTAEIQVQATETTSSTPVPEISTVPVVTVPPTAEPTPTLTPTEVPIIEEDTVWINLSHLIMRAQPDFSYDKIANIPYGTKVMGEIDGLWMLTSYNGVEGYIYVGKMKDTDRPCVVYSESDLQPLD